MIERIKLPNGLTVLCEPMPGVRSASLGIYIKAGSRSELPSEEGIAHFTEHMVFKGTARYDAGELARRMDALGGQINAYTAKEHTCFYAKVLDHHVPQAFDLLCDMVTNARFAPADIALERGVVGEEIDMYEDSPEDLVVEQLSDGVFPGSGLSHNILGSRERLNAMDHDAFVDFNRRFYRADNLVIAIAGSFDRDGFLAGCEAMFPSAAEEAPTAPSDNGIYTPQFYCADKRIEQKHLCLAFPGYALTDPQELGCAVLSNLLGGGASSRLFQRVREELGLCYSIYSFTTAYRDCGLVGIYMALASKNQRKVLELIGEELDDLKQHGAQPEEFQRAKDQMEAGFLMSLESTAARMRSLARSEMVFGRVISVEERLEKLHTLSCEQMGEIARFVFDRSTAALGVVGKLDGKEEHLYEQVRS